MKEASVSAKRLMSKKVAIVVICLLEFKSYRQYYMATASPKL